MNTLTTQVGTKKERYEELLPQISSLVSEESDLIANLGNVSAALKTVFADFLWVGFYLLKNDELVLGPFQGRVACVRIKLGQGVCGSAALQRKTLIVSDVTKFPGHIACDPASKSEIVVPLCQGEKIYGVIDVDSAEYGSFDETDAFYLQEIGEIVSVKF